MKLITIFFVLVAFTIFRVLYSETGAENMPAFTFPTFQTHVDAELKDLSGGCTSFADCTEFLAYVFYNIGLSIVKILDFLFALVIFIAEFFILLFEVSFTGIDGAPWWVNVLMPLPLALSLSLISYKLIRKGDANAD